MNNIFSSTRPPNLRASKAPRSERKNSAWVPVIAAMITSAVAFFGISLQIKSQKDALIKQMQLQRLGDLETVARELIGLLSEVVELREAVARLDVTSSLYLRFNRPDTNNELLRYQHAVSEYRKARFRIRSIIKFEESLEDSEKTLNTIALALFDRKYTFANTDPILRQLESLPPDPSAFKRTLSETLAKLEETTSNPELIVLRDRAITTLRAIIKKERGGLKLPVHR